MFCLFLIFALFVVYADGVIEELNEDIPPTLEELRLELMSTLETTTRAHEIDVLPVVRTYVSKMGAMFVNEDRSGGSSSTTTTSSEDKDVHRFAQPLILASKRNLVHVVRAFLRLPHLLRAKDAEGKSALIVAAQQGHHEVLEAMLRRVQELSVYDQKYVTVATLVCAVDNKNQTALMWAIAEGNYVASRLLVDYTAPVDLVIPTTSSDASLGLNAIMFMLLSDYRGQHSSHKKPSPEELFTTDLEKKALGVNKNRKYGITPPSLLNFALEKAKQALSNSPTDHHLMMYIHNPRYTSPFDYLNYFNAAQSAYSPLMLASMLGLRAQATSLLRHVVGDRKKRAIVNERNRKNETAMGLALKYGQLDMMRFLRDQGADLSLLRGPMYPGSSCNDTMLIWAIRRSDKQAIDFFLRELKVDVDEAGDYGITPLIWAVRRKQMDTVLKLIHHKANRTQASISGRTALHRVMHMTESKHQIEFTKTLAGEGLKDIRHIRTIVNLPDSRGFTPLTEAIYYSNNPEVVRYLLLGCGANVKLRDKDGRSMLEIAQERLENITDMPGMEQFVGNQEKIVEIVRKVMKWPTQWRLLSHLRA